jgi:hypothetical protein
VIDKKIDQDIEIPKWDVALAALAKEEYQHKGEALRLEDFHRLAKEHAIRFDDIMVTMFELCINSEWRYQVDSGVDLAINREMLDKLFVKGRLHEGDLKDFSGTWRPVK